MKEVRIEIGDILDRYCQPCTKTMHLKDGQITKVCDECKIGQKLQQLGSYLGEPFEEDPNRIPIHQKLTKKEYLTYKENGKTDQYIVKEKHMSHHSLNRLKKEWGIQYRKISV